MELARRGKPAKKYLALSFFLPFLGYTLVMLASQYSPFGSSSILYSDMYHQYYPFFAEYRRVLRAGGSLLHNWNLGMGVDYLALISYYLASPLNLFSVLVPEHMLLGLFSLLVPIRLGLAGLFFGIFLRKVFRANDWSVPLFSCFYALCAWALGYQWNLMWLDTFALLPLVVLGMLSLLRERRFVLYTITLFLSVFSNYYIGLFTCIFVALSFILYEICYGKGFRRFLGDLCCMLVFSALAIAMTAILELPAYLALANTNSSVNQFPTGFSLNIAKSSNWQGLLDAMRQVAGNTAGGLEPSYKEGLPNLYCGVLSLILAIQFCLSKKIRLREKLCSVGLLLFFMLSFILRQLDYIWHGFHFTNMIPYRFSFLFSFVVLCMAYRAYQLREEYKPWQIMTSLLVVLGLTACSDQRFQPVFLAYNLTFLVLYGLLLLSWQRPKLEPKPTSALRDPGIALGQPQPVELELIPLTAAQKGKNQKLSLLLLAAMILELAANLVNFGVTFTGTGISNYPKGKRDTADVIAYMKERETGNPFYRAEFTHTQTLNDDALNGISGITMFSSSANVRVTRFMAALGYGAKPSYNRYSYEEASPVSNLFLNLKYMICRDGNVLNSAFFDSVYNLGNVYLLENNAYLPLGFMTNSNLAEISVEDSTAGSFDFQNLLFRAAAGIQDSPYTIIEQYKMEAEEDITVTQRAAGGYCSYETKEKSGDLTVSFLVDRPGFVCLDLSASKKNGVTISKNGETLYTETMSLDQMLSVGDCVAGDLIEVTFRCKANEKGRLEVVSAVLDPAVFHSGLERLQRATLQVADFQDTRIAGTVEVDDATLLYTSIPYDENWTATVDGAPVEITPVLDAMIGLHLTPGSHTIAFSYQNRGFDLGWKISLGALLIFLAIAIPVYWPRRRQGKYQAKNPEL